MGTIQYSYRLDLIKPLIYTYIRITQLVIPACRRWSYRVWAAFRIGVFASTWRCSARDSSRSFDSWLAVSAARTETIVTDCFRLNGCCGLRSGWMLWWCTSVRAVDPGGCGWLRRSWRDLSLWTRISLRLWCSSRWVFCCVAIATERWGASTRNVRGCWVFRRTSTPSVCPAASDW